MKSSPDAKSPALPSLTEIKAALPAHCFVSDLRRSLLYAARDVALALALFAAIWLVEGWRRQQEPGSVAALVGALAWPLYWLAQGTVFWAIFVVGHDCGHGSFSRYPWVNDVVGLLLHSAILVPFESWKLTHRHHHKHTCDIDQDSVFFPTRLRDAGGAPFTATRGWYFLGGVSWLGYLFVGYAPRSVLHLWPLDPAFRGFRARVACSVAAWVAVLATLLLGWLRLGWWSGRALTAFYGAPLLVFATWLVVTTFLHHQDDGLEWLAGDEWDYVRGNLSTVDRHYGAVHALVHHIGTHQVHHLFPIIPHYHLEEATRAFRRAFPHLVRVSDEPIHRAFFRVFDLFAARPPLPDDCRRVAYPSRASPTPAAAPPTLLHSHFPSKSAPSSLIAQLIDALARGVFSP